MNAKMILPMILTLLSSPQMGLATDPPQLSVRQLRSILREQGFSGALDRDASFKNLGVFSCGDQKYRIFYFVWAETRPDGSPGHGQQRIVIIGAGDKYIGSYWIDDPPVKVTRNSILLSNDPNDKDEIRCEDGELPNDRHPLGK